MTGGYFMSAYPYWLRLLLNRHLHTHICMFVGGQSYIIRPFLSDDKLPDRKRALH